MTSPTKANGATPLGWRAIPLGDADILLNNAGVFYMASIDNTKLSDYRRVIEVNQVGVFLGLKSATPAMTARGAVRL